MKFDADRLSMLAGIGGGTSSGLLSEGAGMSDSEPSETNEKKIKKFANIEEIVDDGMDDMQEEGDGPPVDSDVEEMVEIDENMLRREIMKMRQTRLAETKIRDAIRSEINSIISEDTDDDDLYLTADWLYGKNKPRNSRKGTVATALPGLGFKKF